MITLAPLIPYLISSLDQAAEREADLAVCASVLATAANLVPRELTDDLRRQLTEQVDGRPAGRRERRRLMAITDHALRLMSDATEPSGRDGTLYDVLQTAVNGQRAHDHLSPVVPPVGSSLSTHDSLTVLTRLTEPVGADWLEVEAQVDPSYRPDWLTAGREAVSRAHR